MRNVFIVDDEPFILEGLTSIIDWEEFGIVLAGKAVNGLLAFEALKDTGTDILITDIMMPEMNGLELIQQLKPLYPDMKVIVLSGYNEFDYIKEGMRLGIEDYLLKPVNLKELTEAVTAVMQRIELADRQAVAMQNQMDILHDNVINRWLSGKIDPAELSNRLKFLGISTDHPFYMAASIKTTPEIGTLWGSTFFKGNQERNREVYQLIRGKVENRKHVICCFDTDGDTILIFSASHSGTVETDAVSLLHEVRRELAQLSGYQVLITLGSLSSHFSEVPLSYDHAKRLQEYFLTNAESEIIRYDHVMTFDSPSGETSVNLFEFEQYLHLDKASLNRYIDKIFAELQAMESISPAQIHNCAIELILCVKQVIKENKLNHELATSDYKQLFTSLFKAPTIGQLTDHVKFIAGSAADYLSNQDDEFNPVVKQVLHQIQTRYTEEMSLKTLSQALHIHPYYLGQLFQKETGKSFTDYLNSYRIKKAQKLLKTTSMKASEISRQIGYWDPGYFYKQFKKYTGQSPIEYRGKPDQSKPS